VDYFQLSQKRFRLKGTAVVDDAVSGHVAANRSSEGLV
jgi:hypothetical protein